MIVNCDEGTVRAGERNCVRDKGGAAAAADAADVGRRQGTDRRTAFNVLEID